MNERKPQAFVLMSFAKELDWAYDDFIRPALEESGYVAIRADDIDNQQNILKDIVTSIVKSDLIVADLTDDNRNVYYELGLAHAFGKPVILLSQNKSTAPFDLLSYRIEEYSDRFDLFPKAKKRLTDLARGAHLGDVSFGNPASDFVPQAQRTSAREPSSAFPMSGEQPTRASGEDLEVVRNHGGVEVEEEPGVLDLMAQIQQGFADQSKCLEEGAAIIVALGDHASESTPKIKEQTASKNLQGLRTVFRQSASFYASKTSELHDINNKLRSSWEHTSDALEKRSLHSMAGTEVQTELLPLVQGASANAAEARKQMVGFMQTVDDLPNVDSMFTRAKRKLARELGVLVAYMDDVASFESRLVGMIEVAGGSSAGRLNGSGEGGGSA